MVGAGSAEVDSEDEEEERNVAKESSIKYIKDIDLGSEESEGEVEMIELDGEDSDSDEEVECKEEDDDDIQAEEVPVEHLEGATKERKRSGSLNSLLDSDNDD